MDMIEQIAVALHEFFKDNNSVFLKFNPEITDFRKPYKGTLLLLGRKSNAELTIPQERLNTFVGILMHSLFSKDVVLVAWDIKRFMSYLKFHLGKFEFNIACKLYDLKLAEAFLGLKRDVPNSWKDAVYRVKDLANNDALMNIHRKVHLPLALRVIPAIETLGVGEIDKRRIYSFYHIEGQNHGRLKCVKAFEECFLSHTIKHEQKLKLRTPHEKDWVVLDYKHMEVSVLQWLSGDEKLGLIIKSGRDLYKTVYHLFSGKPCDSEDKRNLIKTTLLPIFYGMQADGLASRLRIAKTGAKWLLKQVRDNFPQAIAWLDEQQHKAATDGELKDYFGRPRFYPEKSLSSRNLVVQGPAAMVCEEKLIQLYDTLHDNCDIAATIHDAYMLIAEQRNIMDTAEAAKAVLESPSNLCQGLRLKVSYKIGAEWTKAECLKSSE